MPGICIAIAAASFLLGCDRLLSDDARLDRAATQVDAGNYDAALGDLKVLLESAPREPRLRVLLAKVALQMGDGEGAQKELDQAIAAGAAPEAIDDLALGILVARGKHAEVLRLMQDKQAFPSPAAAAATIRSFLALSQTKEAVAAADRAIRAFPESGDVHIAEAQARVASGDSKAALAALDAVIAKDGDNSAALLLKGQLTLAAGDAKSALAALRQARGKAGKELSRPHQAELRAWLVEANLAAKDLAGAREELSQLQARVPGSFAALFLAGKVALTDMDPTTAAAEFQKALAVNPGAGSARLLLGAALLDKGSTEQAEQELRQLLAAEPGNAAARQLLARLYLSRNDTEGARQVLTESMLGLQDAELLRFATSVLLATGDLSDAINVLRKAVEQQPASAEPRLALAQAYLRAGRSAEAAEALKSVAPAQGGTRLRQLKVAVEVIGRSPKEALRAINGLIDEQPRDLDLVLLGASVLANVGESNAAEDLYDRAIALDPANVDGRLGLAALAARTGTPDRAAGLIDEVLKLDPLNQRALLARAALAYQKGDKGSAKGLLERAISAAPAAVEPRLMLAELAFQAGDLNRASAMVDQALTVTKTRGDTLNAIGQLLLRHSRYEEALARFEESEKLGAQSSLVGAAVALNALGRERTARARLEAAIAKKPDWLQAVAMLVAIDVGQKEYEVANRRVAAYERASGNPAAASELRGDVLAAQGKPREAAQAYERIPAEQVSGRVATKAFAQKVKAGLPSPDVALLAWLGKNPTDVPGRMALAAYFMEAGNSRSAIAQYEAALAIRADAVTLNNLAWLYYEDKNPKSTDLARRAYELAPMNPRIQDTYGWILVESGRVEEGAKLLGEAAKAAPNDSDIQYHHAVALARAGRRPQAVEVLNALLATNRAFPARGEAESLRKTLSAGDAR